MAKKKNTKSFEQTLNGFNKKYGDGTLFKLGDKGYEGIDVISTGSIGCDIASGVGGIPLGRVTEILGKEMSAKSTLALHTVVNCQKMFGVNSAAVIDVEHALDLKYVKNIGVDTDNLVVSQPDFGEQALDIACDMIDSGYFKLVVVDSVAALIPQEYMDKDLSDKTSQASLARLMSKALSKINTKCSKMGASIIFINQLRALMNVMFGKKTHSSGGNALRFYSCIRIETTPIKSIKDDKGRVKSSIIKAKYLKNKVAPPFGECTFEVVFGEGINLWGELFDYMLECKVVKKKGNTYSVGNSTITGRNNAVKILKNKYGDEGYFKLRKKIMKKLIGE